MKSQVDTNYLSDFPPYLNNPFLSMNNMMGMEEDFGSMGSDDDYAGVYEDPTQLSVIDEYLLAAQKNPSASNGGTQNIALGGNEIKTGFDQEEIVKIDDVKTVYEDCAFHKFDISRQFYSKDMLISDLLVVDGFLVAIVKDELHENKAIPRTSYDADIKNYLIVISIIVSKKQLIDITLVAQHMFTNDILIKDLVCVPCRKLPSSMLGNLTALDHFENAENNTSCSNFIPKSLVLLGLSDNSLMFLSVPQLTQLKMTTNLSNDKEIHKITYCSALSSIAICDSDGYFTLCPCATNQDKPYEMNLNDCSSLTGKYFFVIVSAVVFSGQ